MGFLLSPTALSAGYRLEEFDKVGSTNALALERAIAGDQGRLWLVTKNQQQGRGRRGRPWQTQQGNLAATLLFMPETGLKHAATLGFVAGLALAEALAAAAPDVNFDIGIDGGSVADGRGRFELKWPNDLLASGAKLSGILLESVMLDNQRFALAIGIGVNVAAYPDDTPYPATSLSALGSGCDAEQLFLALSDAWVRNERLWAEGQGLATIRQRWLKQAAGLNSQVAVRMDGEIIRGVFETIDDECRFVIRKTDGGEVTVSAGDVHFGAVASA